jgi:hypothetical protein
LQAQQQPKGKALELIIDLRIMVEELLKEYHKALGKFPKRILFLRDGVSEGQFSEVYYINIIFYFFWYNFLIDSTT